jgi:hypothetical protein
MMRMRYFPLALGLVTGGVLVSSADARTTWKKHDINAESPFEAVGAADFDGDGQIDIFSGDSWYKAPTWERKKVREVPLNSGGNYHMDFGDMPMDVNGDGYTDLVTCSYFGRTVGWVQHPGADATQPWVQHDFDKAGPAEACHLIDINGDGRLDLLPSLNNAVVWFDLVQQKPEVKWEKRMVGTEGVGHGVGVGDINSDGRLDIIVPKGWWEQPKDAIKDPWMFHADFKLGGTGILILGRDVDGDKLTDVVWGMGHNYGLFWIRQLKNKDGSRGWGEKQEIDAKLPEVHTLVWADVDGNGTPALITGKRVYGHEVEPGDLDAPIVAAYRFNRKSKAWVKDVIFQGEAAKNAPTEKKDRNALKDFARGSAGTGLYIEVRDIDKDGDLDLVCPGKSGLYLFENLRKTPKKNAGARKRTKP